MLSIFVSHLVITKFQFLIAANNDLRMDVYGEDSMAKISIVIFLLQQPRYRYMENLLTSIDEIDVFFFCNTFIFL